MKNLKFNRNQRKWGRLGLGVLSGVVVFVTTYALILPAITLDRGAAAEEPGLRLAESFYEATVFEEEWEEPEFFEIEDDAAFEEDSFEVVDEWDDEMAPEEAPGPDPASEDGAVPSAGEFENADEAELDDEDRAEAAGANGAEAADGTGNAADGSNFAETAAEQEDAALSEAESITEGVDSAVDSPALFFHAELEDMGLIVEADAPEGAFPVGTSMSVLPIYEQSVLDVITETVEGSVTAVVAVDITFLDSDGGRIEPACPIRVTMTSVAIAEAEQTTIVHLDDDGETEVIAPVEDEGAAGEVSEEQVVFEAEAFSIYAVVGTETIVVDYLTKDGSTYQITVDISDATNIPNDAELEIRELSGDEYDTYLAKTANALGTATDSIAKAKLFDISIVQDGQEIQPNGKVGVEIKLKNDYFEDPQVVHFGEQTEVLDATTEGNTVSFETDGFSIYAIVDTGNDDHATRVKYVFQNKDGSEYKFLNTAGDEVDYQIIKNGESLENIGIPTIDAGGETFNGWYIFTSSDGESGILTGEKISFGSAIAIDGNAERTNITAKQVDVAAADNQSGEDGTDPDYTIYVRPSFGPVSYITFWNEVDGKVIYTKLQVPQGSTYNIANQKAVPPDAIVSYDDEGHEVITYVSYAFTGWSEKAGTLETTGNLDTRTEISETEITVNKELEFYPIFRLSHWISFFSAPTGSGATYFSPKYVLSGHTAEEAKPTTEPVWEGHTFVGWFTQEDGDYLSADETADGAFDFNQTIDEDITLYAHWNAGTANYTIIYWQQLVSDSKDYTGSQKNYEYGGQKNVVGAVNSTITVENAYEALKSVTITKEDGTTETVDKTIGFEYNASKSDTSVVVVADGTSVINVYLDRKLIQMVFVGQGNSQGTYYSEITSANGTQYGYVNGQYVQLTRDNGTQQTTHYLSQYTSAYQNYHSRSSLEYTGTVYSNQSGTVASNPTYPNTYYHRSNGGGGYPGGGGASYTALNWLTDTETVYAWTYTDSDGNTHTYTGTRYTRTTENNTTVYIGLYGQTLEQNGYTWPDGNWSSKNTSGKSYSFAFLPEFIPPSGYSETMIFNKTSTSNDHVYVYFQNIDGSYNDNPDITSAMTQRHGVWYFDEEFTGFTVDSYQSGTGDGRNGANGNKGTWTTTSVGGNVDTSNKSLGIKYRRLTYEFKYLDSRNGTELTEISTANPATKSVVYGAAMSTANPKVTTLTPPTSQYEWDGHWYTDQACTTIALFSSDISKDGELGNYTSIDTENHTVTYGTKTYEYQILAEMPAHDMAVYAGWTEKWYWVKLEPDGGELTGTEATWFWETLGEKVEEYHDVVRQYVEDPNGEWYYHYDEFDPETEANQYGTNVRKAYYFKADGTGLPDGVTLQKDGAAAWSYDGKTYKQDAKAYSLVGWYEVDQETNQLLGLYNFDGGVTGNTILRAVWRTVGEYKVRYSTQGVDSDGNPINYADDDELHRTGRVSSEEGTQPIDGSSYADKSNSAMGSAITTEPEGYTFMGWYYNETVYNPGDAYMIQSELAVKETTESGETEKVIWIYPVFVATENLPVEITQITWHGNDGTTSMSSTDEITVSDEETIITPIAGKINANVSLTGTNEYFTRNGYKFLGWAKSANATTPWLAWDSETSKYKLGDDTVSYVAADNNDAVYTYDGDGNITGITYNNDLYALWEVNTYTVTVKKVVSSDLAEDQKSPFVFTPVFSATGLPENYQYNFSLTGEETTVTGEIESGETVTTTPKTEKVFEDIPYGTTVKFTEGDYSDFTVTVAGSYKDDSSAEHTIDSLSNGAVVNVNGDTTITFTNTRRITSIGVKKTDESEIELSDAEFTLTRYNGASYEIVSTMKVEDSTVTNGKVTGVGNVTISNLPAGNYKLVESKAPDGYIIASNEIEFTVSFDADGNTKVDLNSSPENASVRGTTITVTNNPGQALPNTGGPGTLIYTLSGLMLIIFAASMYGFKMRRRERRIN